jgi:TM2 domain-containing membrane protein YozV
MKTIKSLLTFILIIILFLPSCSIEKRVHLTGYHIDWKNSNQRKEISKFNSSPQQNSFTKNDAEQILIGEPFENLSASTNNSQILPNKAITEINKKSIDFNDCDIIILRNGAEIKAKVLEVGSTEIKYKNCDNQNGPTFTKIKADIFMIKYPNGTSTVMEETKTSSSNVTVNVNTTSQQNTSNKSLIVAVLLWLFLGVLGIHRFYLGHIGMGVLYLLTGSLCGLGWFIDGILFLTGGLKPKDGDYIN